MDDFGFVADVHFEEREFGDVVNFPVDASEARVGLDVLHIGLALGGGAGDSAIEAFFGDEDTTDEAEFFAKSEVLLCKFRRVFNTGVLVIQQCLIHDVVK